MISSKLMWWQSDGCVFAVKVSAESNWHRSGVGLTSEAAFRKTPLKILLVEVMQNDGGCNAHLALMLNKVKKSKYKNKI